DAVNHPAPTHLLDGPLRSIERIEPHLHGPALLLHTIEERLLLEVGQSLRSRDEGKTWTAKGSRVLTGRPFVPFGFDEAHGHRSAAPAKPRRANADVRSELHPVEAEVAPRPAASDLNLVDDEERSRIARHSLHLLRPFFRRVVDSTFGLNHL